MRKLLVQVIGYKLKLKRYFIAKRLFRKEIVIPDYNEYLLY